MISLPGASTERRCPRRTPATQATFFPRIDPRGVRSKRPPTHKRTSGHPAATADSSDPSFRSLYPPLETDRFVLDLDGEANQLILETGAMGRQANGAVLARQGDTVRQPLRRFLSHP